MGKISPVSAKYIIYASIEIEGVVDKPDVIGAIFGQTEGLLGNDLELRELQKSGRIGRIEVNSDVKSGKTNGEIVIPSSLDKAETSIVGAALEVINRIGPCNAKIEVKKIEDVRISKRSFIVTRAKQLLKTLVDEVMPDSQEISEEVAESVRAMEIMEYGKDKLPAGPTVKESEEIIVVEGRADVLNLLKNGIKNAVAMNGTSCPPTIIELCKQKTVTVFVDGDRGGDLILKALFDITDIDFVTRAPDGKEVEEITKKEIHKAIRARITAEQARMELGVQGKTTSTPQSNEKKSEPVHQQSYNSVERSQTPQSERPHYNNNAGNNMNSVNRFKKYQPNTKFERPVQTSAPESSGPKVNTDQKKIFKDLLDEVFGTRGAYVLDEKLNTLGKVPVAEVSGTIEAMGKGVHAIIIDGKVDENLALTAEKSGVRYIVSRDGDKSIRTRVKLITAEDLK